MKYYTGQAGGIAWVGGQSSCVGVRIIGISSRPRSLPRLDIFADKTLPTPLAVASPLPLSPSHHHHAQAHGTQTVFVMGGVGTSDCQGCI